MMRRLRLRDEYGISAFGFSVAFIVVGAILVACVLAVSYPVNRKSCLDTAAKYGVEGDFGLWTGCLFKVDGKFVNKDNYIVNQPVRR